MKNTNLTNQQRSYRLAAKLGLITAAIFIAYQLLIHFAGVDQGVGARFAKYLFLVLIIGYGINQHRKWTPDEYYYNRSIVFGIILGAVTAITLMPINIALFVINPQLVVSDTFALEQNLGFVLLNDMANLLIYASISFFISFLWTEYLTRDRKESSSIKVQN